MTMGLFVNPGSGPVADATEANAIDNIVAFAEEVAGARGWDRVAESRWPDKDAGGGRYAFSVAFRNRNTGKLHSFEVCMPGLPLDQVNFGTRPDDNPWLFPRLYVDGSSWLWKYAVDVCGPGEE